MKARKSISFTIGAVIAAIVAGIFSYFLSKGPVGLIVDIVIALVMLICILLGIWRKTGIASLEKATYDLKSITEAIEEKGKDPTFDEDFLIESIPGFNNKDLGNAFQAYKKERDRLFKEEQEYRYCDIGDYINDELLNNIASSKYNDLVGSTMTGLGILGTFIGLTIGLQGFKNGSAEEMLETITPLIDGIKVAFLTSIFGMAASILFNFFYHKSMREAEEALEIFQETFYDMVSQRPDNEGFTKLISLQEEQKDSMSQLAEEISMALANLLNESFIPTMQSMDNSMQSLGDSMQSMNDTLQAQSRELPEAIKTAVTVSVVPTLAGIEDNIGQMTSQITSTQSQNIERVADDFVAHMDMAMGNQLTKLSDAIAQLCAWQESISGQMKEVAEGLVASGDKLNHIYTEIDQASESFDHMVTRIERSQEDLLGNYTSVIKNCEQLSEATRKQNKQLDELLMKEKESLESVSEIGTIINEQKDLMRESFESLLKLVSSAIQEQQQSIDDEMRKRYEAIEKEIGSRTVQVNQSLEKSFESLKADADRIETLHAAMISSMNGASIQMKNSADAMTLASDDLTKNLDNAMYRTFRQIDEQLADIEKHLSGTIAEIKDVVTSVPDIIELSSKSNAENSDKYLEKVQEAIDTLAKTIDAREELFMSVVEKQQSILQSLAESQNHTESDEEQHVSI